MKIYNKGNVGGATDGKRIPPQTNYLLDKGNFLCSWLVTYRVIRLHLPSN